MRKTFKKTQELYPNFDLIEIQKKSYQWFLKEGIGEVLKESSNIQDYRGRDLELHFIDYYLEEPKFDEITTKERNLTYEAALKVRAKLINKKTGKKIEQEIYLGDIPLMTERGTFIINGIERVVVNQLIRSPGVFFTADELAGRNYYRALIIPDRGAWLEIETSYDHTLWVRINRQRKVIATAFLRIFGFNTKEEILNAFFPSTQEINEEEKKYLENTLKKDPAFSEEEGILEVYRKIRPSEFVTIDSARHLIQNMFFNPDRYNLGRAGRYKINQRLNLKYQLPPEKLQVLQKEDIKKIIQEVIRLNVSQAQPDDIDHLGNRRIRAVGELVQSRMRVGLMRMRRIVKDRMSTLDTATLTPAQLVNPQPVISVIREFFMLSQLSQFMDQTNPLAELEHKRRLTMVGPGGLSRERAGFEVRDVHQTYYGRICPIATPEGQNVGLVGHFACYARLNPYGFLETPYRKVVKIGKKMKVTDEIIWLDAFEEEKYNIAPASIPLDEAGFIIPKTRIEARIKGEPGFALPEQIDLVDIACQQIISLGTALIPFLEHDDAVRALMGTNMQRQAVPLISPEAPLIGTGLEEKVARDSGYLVVAEEDGEIVESDAGHLKLKSRKKTLTYQANKFIRSNANTCLNQRILVEKGQKVKKGDVLIDGPAMEKGELALGRNVLVAFMPWEGGNYQDAILISSRLVKEDVFSSIHISEHLVEVRETKLGPEVITRDIPNVSEMKLKELDSEGIIRIGAEVKSGDILVGKITPKGETELSTEEKLLRAIFGEKAKDVRDTSLYLEHGEHGKVIEIKTFSREQGDKLPSRVLKTIYISVADLRKIQPGDKLANRHGNKGVVSKIIPEEDMPFLEDGTPIDIILNPLGIVSRMNIGQILETHLGMAAKTLGYQAAIPSLNGPRNEEIKKELAKINFPLSGKVKLYDGRTGQPFANEITVGYMYMMKLNHLVEDKIHQRSIGPYSLITQQPLGGKAQRGGQRFGEMEVWALEAHGAAYTLQEMLTIKSDDVTGRTRAYSSIIKGEKIQDVYLPESFQILIRELKALGLGVELIKDKSLQRDKSTKIGEKNS
ncbi:MAG: DNA-directed RNA polymerase subunit beta [Patescibacteria group bacterium]|nr:DNA-directed RNA polymerase subunit beta [Patescibacteria group bacterium]